VLAPQLHLIILRTLLSSFISPIYIAVVIDYISQKALVSLLSCEGIDQTILILYSLRLLLTFPNPILA
jgi:hypothetical protein